jgi:predicted lipid-binding transport protein (Tim44 family)
MSKLALKPLCLFFALAIATSLWMAVAANARPGGGHTHSSSSSSRSSSSGSSSRSSSSSSRSSPSSLPPGPIVSGTSGGSGGGFAGAIVLFFIIVFVIIVLVVIAKARKTTPAPPMPETGGNLDSEIDALKRADPNFSLVLFIDFVNKLYAQAHEARGSGKLDLLAPYIEAGARQKLSSLGSNQTGLRDVTGVVIGSSKIVDARNTPEGTSLTVFFEANYTEIEANGREQSYYVEERWEFWRRAGVLSLPPGKIDAIHCPKCGGPLERTETGACPYCNRVVQGGQFHWFVTGIETLARETRGPQLTEETQETGTDLPTIYQPNLSEAKARFMAENPDFSWERMNERVVSIFNQIAQAWTTLDWEKARPFETDNVFQMHRYWIEAYKRQHLRNIFDQVRVLRIEWVKIEQDAYYDALTARIWASGLDYTIDDAGNVVCGSPTRPRVFTEYWTFIRTRGARPVEHRDDRCPNCGAPLQINMAGICEYCGGKITSGDFDWVLSRIEQDESYTG